MELLDYTKASLLLFSLFVFTPVVGVLMRHRRWSQKLMFLAMCFMTISGFFKAEEWGFTIHPVLYRGTARGFHFYCAEFAALALIWAQMTGSWRQFRFFPPGLWLYLLYCAVSLISLINAPVPLYGAFAAVKAIKVIVIFIAAYNFIQEEADLRYVLVCMSVTMFWQLIVVLKQKYMDRIYQVWGTFEHQNSLSMYTILIGMVFLAVALGPRHRSANYFLVAYIGCAAIVQSTLSRGGLLVFAVGTVTVVILSLIDRPTKRRVIVLSSLACVAAIGLLFTMDTIIARFKDYGTQESLNTRRMLNVSARLMLRDHSMGVGWNNFGVVINKPYPYGDHIDAWQEANGNRVDPKYQKGISESLYWLILAENGYAGFAIYLLFMLAFLGLNVWHTIYFRRRFLGAVSMGILIGTVCNYLQSFLERVLTQPRNMMLWFILLAAAARIETWRRREMKYRWLRWKASMRQRSMPAKVREQELQAA